MINMHLQKGEEIYAKDLVSGLRFPDYFKAFFKGKFVCVSAKARSAWIFLPDDFGRRKFQE